MTNEQTVEQINKDLNVVVENVTYWAQEELRKTIDKWVYKWGEAMKQKAFLETGQHTAYYIHNNSRPTRQLYNSITIDRIHSDLKNYIGYMIFSDPTKMDYDGKDGLHGTETHDYRAVLLERLNESKDDIPNKARMRWWTTPYTMGARNGFFDRFLDYLQKNVYHQFELEMTKRGMKWRKEGVFDDGELL